MSHSILFRLSQLLLVVPCALREWVNCFTDIGQYERVVKLSTQIMTYPTKQAVGTLFEHSMPSVVAAKCAALLWIIAHGLSAAIITYGLCMLTFHLKASSAQFNQRKLTCCLGLSIALFSYVFLLGFSAMDYFFSWMQSINFNGDITGYGLPLVAALLYLTVKDSALS